VEKELNLPSPLGVLASRMKISRNSTQVEPTLLIPIVGVANCGAECGLYSYVAPPPLLPIIHTPFPICLPSAYNAPSMCISTAHRIHSGPAPLPGGE